VIVTRLEPSSREARTDGVYALALDVQSRVRWIGSYLKCASTKRFTPFKSIALNLQIVASFTANDHAAPTIEIQTVGARPLVERMEHSA